MELLGIPEEKIEVIYFGVGEEYKPSIKRDDKADILRKIGIGEGEFILYAMGTIEPRKNIKNLLEAYRLFIEKCKKDVSLVLVGIGRFPEDVREKVEEYNLNGNVILKEGIPEEYMPVLMNSACLFIYPSLYEGFGLPVLEAMACGKAVITSNVSSMPEVVGDAGVLIDPQNIEGISSALRKVILDERFRNDLEKRALDRSRLFSWERCARETLKVYGER
jgi:glycosyltransferase involved in cell wall biosynthesis